ncbi:MAG TPA: sigma-54-dependent Fis family transcriptional regulator [Luteibacter sp.]|nr:sigma-54-dependent Fis family transcriptional regulator [Luteibacter sp.]
MLHSEPRIDRQSPTARLWRERMGGEKASRHVLSSWQRCLDEYGTDPDARRETPVLEAAELRDRQSGFGELLQVARAEMENLYEQIAGSGYAVILSDAQAVILDAITDPTLKREFRESGLRSGAIWNERFEGTNGLGTCLAEHGPVTVHREEHFRRFNCMLSCSGAPILGLNGEIVGVLDASTVNSPDSKLIQRHTMALVNMSANLIARCHFLRELRHSWVIRFHSRPEFVGLLHEALLAVDDQGRIEAVNESALTQLGMSREQLVGVALETILPFRLEELEKRAASEQSMLWSIRDVAYGRRFYANARAPTSASIASPRQTSSGTAKPAARRLIGGDARMQHNINCGRQLFGRRVPILLQGETGTGKEVFAKELHQASAWAERPFVAVNCAAIPESLIESELFGYTRGAFTDAAREGHLGKIRHSSGGTLFLDEIGDMPLHMQTRLLRVLEEHEVVPLGGDKAVPVDLHIISASHQDLLAMVREGRFREDLYYRLNGITLQLPPLRERSDRRELITTLLAEENTDGPLPTIGEEAMQALLEQPWPGNIRQMRNVLRSASALCEGKAIGMAHLPAEFQRAGVTRASFATTTTTPLRTAERDILLRELDRLQWNVKSTAAALGMSRNTLYRKLHKHGIELPE